MNRRFSWMAIGQLMLLTVLGVLLAGGFHFPGDFGTLEWARVRFDLSAVIFGFILGAVSGVMIAGLQALVLRTWGVPVRRWILFSAAGYGLVHALADGFPYRPLVIVGGGIVLALCQYLALRRALSRPAWVLPIAAGAWWLGFGLTAGVDGYNLIVIALLLGTATGLTLRLWLVPTAPPAPNAFWAGLTRPRRVLLVIGLMAGLAVFLVLYASLTGLTGIF
jgi:hypothetical protein